MLLEALSSTYLIQHTKTFHLIILHKHKHFPLVDKLLSIMHYNVRLMYMDRPRKKCWHSLFAVFADPVRLSCA